MAARPRNILVGYDGSASAERALDAAAALVGYGSQLTVVSVRDGAFRDEVSNAARRRLQSLQIAARYLEPVGEAAETLLETASAIGADLVVVGRREQNALQRLVLGSVSSKIVGRAACDVLVVR